MNRVWTRVNILYDPNFSPLQAVIAVNIQVYMLSLCCVNAAADRSQEPVKGM